MSIRCPYCENQAPLTHSRVIYGRDYGWLYWCEPCDAYVGCHKGTVKPKGHLANAKTRNLRKAVHRLFDPIWKNKIMCRRDAYKWLSKKMGIDFSQCHVAMFNDELCVDAIKFCVEFKTRDIVHTRKTE